MNKHIGSSLGSLFDELGESEGVELLASKKILAKGILAGMKRQKISKTALAARMRTSRTVVHRLLDPSDTGVTLATLAKASQALGLHLAVGLTSTRRPSAGSRPRRAA